MDLDEFRSILRKSGVDVWSFIDSAISVAVFDYRDELKQRRDGIVEKLYAAPPPPPAVLLPPSSRCQNNFDESPKQIHEINKKDNRSINPSMTPQSNDGDGDGDDDDFRDQIIGNSIDEEQTTKILSIKEDLEDPHQTEESLVHLLQNLADMDISFNALKDTDIGRHVNRLRKNPSSDVRKLVKQLVRKWKELVDEWVKINADGGGNGVAASALIDGGDYSPPEQNPMRHNQNGHHQPVPDFAYSPNPHNGSSGSDKYNSEPEPKVKANPRREPPPPRPINASTSTQPNKQREQKDSTIDLERLDKARRRLQENYQEANNAKKQRTIQVMDIHELPKPKNSFFAKNKGGSQAKHW